VTHLQKRIYMSFFVLVLLCALLLSVLVSGIIYNAIRNREIDAIRDRANLVADLLNNAVGVEGFSDFSNHNPDAARITIIAPDGTVMLDNKAHTMLLETHADRDEFQQALRTGRGEAVRYSITLGADTYYYAIRLDDGNVLRISKTMDRIDRVFTAILPSIVGVTALVTLLAVVFARRLTRRIIEPLGNINFDGNNPHTYDELLPYVKKINEQKDELAQQMLALKARADTIEAITANMKEGLVLIDKTGVMLAVNKSAADIFREGDMPGRNILYICRDVEFQRCVKECLAGRDRQLSFERGGKVYEVYFNSVREGKAVNGGVVFLLDVSDKHEAERQRREFSANVSHELKTPLTTISALAEMIENGMAKEGDVKAFAGKITAQTGRLIAIIEDIIKLSEFDEGEIAAAHTRFDLHELATSIVEILRERADEKRVSISITGERPQMTANRQMIDELLYNLIDNAIKYNREDGMVTLTLSREGDECKIAVADTGIGIAPEHQSRVFERFYRADKSRSKETGGTGLGLSIVKHIVAHHGGRVALASNTDAGTTVECWLMDGDAGE